MAGGVGQQKDRFAQFFLVSGLDVNVGLEPDEVLHALDFMSEDSSPLDRSYKPRILRHYPDMTGWSHFNPEALSRLCLPNGLRLSVQKARYPPTFHPFVLTKEDGSKSCGFSLVFNEEIKDVNVCHALHTLLKMHTTETECGTIKKTERMRPSSAGRPNNARSRSLPRHYTTRLSGSSLDISDSSYDYRNDKLFATKSIAIICSQPLPATASQVLHAIYNFIHKSDYDINILESFIYNLLYDIPLPSPGRSIRFWCLGDVASISLPKVPLELELFDYPLIEFFELLGVENSVKLLICLLLEHQILVFSSDTQKLMLVCESMTSLINPFSWPHVYVPILPPILENFLDAPVPYVMGLLRRTTDMNLYSRASVCIVDIDSGELELPEELPSFPYEQELIDEIKSVIVDYGGSEGANMLQSQAREQLEEINENTRRTPDLDATVERLNQMIQQFEGLTNTPKKKGLSYEEQMRLNTVLREVFINRFTHMLHSFNHFVIHTSDEDNQVTPSGQSDSPQNFDKISFLSEQIQSHIGFLSGLLETQMFSSFIDQHIQAVQGGLSLDTPFYRRLGVLKSEMGESLVRTPTYDRVNNFEPVLSLLSNRLSKIELTISPQKARRTSESHRKQKGVEEVGIFPLLDPAHFRRKETDNSTAVFIRGDRRSRIMDVNLVPSQNIPLLTPSQASIAETNWKFVNQLLKEAKQKTKRILLEKLGSESVEWGHKNQAASGTEENLLVGSLCDLLERIWCHGMHARQRKSALWCFLFKFMHHADKQQNIKGSLGSQAFCVPLIASKPYLLPDHSRPVQVGVLPPGGRGEGSVATNLNILAIMHNVTTIHEIKTEIGYSRAWIRLALEQKVLASHLSTMLKDIPLLRTLYRRYAFLRCDDEKEQTLYYLQDLNAVDFSCFTNAYFNSYILYQVLIFPSQKAGNSLSSANIWLHVVGSHSETEYLYLPRGIIHFSFWSRNLGVLTSLRLGHDNSGLTPNWLVEHILIKNEFTGHCYKFGCGRWLGKNIDDGSTERYLVGNQVAGVPSQAQIRQLVKECAGPPDVTTPALSLRSTGPTPDDVDIQTMLGEAINRLIKHHHKSLKERVSWAQLMCGQDGLVHALIQVFSFGFKSARLFGRNLTVWDFFLKVTFDFNQSQGQQPQPQQHFANTPHSSPRRRVEQTGTVPRTTQLRRMYTKLITRIETTCSKLGKDDKFQLFVCLAVHDRLLQRIVADLTRAVAAIQLYDEISFLRSSSLAGYLTHVLEALTSIEVPVDPAMKKSLELQ